MEQTTFFILDHINSSAYWEKRVSEFAQSKGMSKRERESFFLEFFVSAYLDNKSKMARKFGVPFTELVFDNPNAPIVGRIVQQYSFYDEKELKRISEGFYHFYRISKFWNEYWGENYTSLHREIDKRFLIRCASTFLTLSYPASYNSYLEKNSQSLFSLFDDQVKNLGFSSIAKLMECSLLFCQPGHKLMFPWDPRKLDNPNLIWNRSEMKGYFEDFKEVLGNFLHTGYSMRHEDYSLFTKIKSGVLPLQYSWRRNSTNETLQDRQAINQICLKYTNSAILQTSPVEDIPKHLTSNEEEFVSLDSSKEQKQNHNTPDIITLLEKVFILEDFILQEILIVEETEEKREQVEIDLKNIRSTVFGSDSTVPNDLLLLVSNHLDRLYKYLQELAINREKTKTIKPALPEVLTDSSILEAFQEEQRIQALVTQIQKIQSPEPLKHQDSTYKLMKELQQKQSILLSNALEQNQKLRNQLQESVSISSTKKALSRYFSVGSLDKLFEHLKGKE